MASRKPQRRKGLFGGRSKKKTPSRQPRQNEEVYYRPSARGGEPIRTTRRPSQRYDSYGAGVYREPNYDYGMNYVPRQPTEREQRRQRKPSIWRSGLLSDFRKPFDTSLLAITLMLLGAGLIALMSASYPEGIYGGNDKIGPFYYIIRQGAWAVVGLVIMGIASSFDYRRYHVLGKGVYMASVVLLILVLTPLGSTINNATRWIFGFQPSELAKLAIILTFSSFVSLNPRKIREVRGLIPYVAAMGLFVVLLYMEPHMSAALIIIVIGISILFVGGMRLWYFVPAGIIGAVIAVFSYLTLAHVHDRVNIFLNPFLDARGTGWQAVNSLIAIGSGGLFGLGLGQSRQKFMYLPEPMNDFIFSVICEELGFIGAILFLIMFAYFIYRGFTIARKAPDSFGCLMAVGITTQFAFQILLNLAVVSGLFPVTGVSLPLFSYGGTALVMQLGEIGILLNISRHIPPSRRG